MTLGNMRTGACVRMTGADYPMASNRMSDRQRARIVRPSTSC
jgi:hypothetical protein